MSWNATLLGFAICAVGLIAVLMICLTVDRTGKRGLDEARSTAQNARYWQRQAKDTQHQLDYYRDRRDDEPPASTSSASAPDGYLVLEDDE